jgi:hypothetical protein
MNRIWQQVALKKDSQKIFTTWFSSNWKRNMSESFHK